jgi:hypothetical protein
MGNQLLSQCRFKFHRPDFLISLIVAPFITRNEARSLEERGSRVLERIYEETRGLILTCFRDPRASPMIRQDIIDMTYAEGRMQNDICSSSLLLGPLRQHSREERLSQRDAPERRGPRSDNIRGTKSGNTN